MTTKYHRLTFAEREQISQGIWAKEKSGNFRFEVHHFGRIIKAWKQQ